jgi:tetratricopeptide (TPR) repeat protein
VIVVLALQAVDWKTDVDAALAAARKEGRLLAVHFWLEGRPLCRTMAEKTFTDPAVASASARFVNLKVNVEDRPDLFTGYVGGRGALATAVVDGTGDVVSVLPGFADAARYRAFLERAERGLAGLKAAREACEKSPGDAWARVELGERYFELDSPRRAEECFLKAIEAGGLRAEAAAHERLARLRVMRGRNVEAREHLAEARKRDPAGRLDRILHTEALAFAIERKFSDSVRTASDAVERHPDSPEMDQLLLTLAWSTHEAGADAKALEILEGMLRRFPDSRWAAAARERVEHIRNPPPDHQH